jgi:hypothetical protein
LTHSSKFSDEEAVTDEDTFPDAITLIEFPFFLNNFKPKLWDCGTATIERKKKTKIQYRNQYSNNNESKQQKHSKSKLEKTF